MVGIFEFKIRYVLLVVVESRGCDKITIFAVAANVVILYGSRDVDVNSG